MSSKRLIPDFKWTRKSGNFCRW